MILYLILITISVLLISVSNIICQTFPNLEWYVVCEYVVLYTLIVCVIDLIVAGLARIIPNSYYNPNKKRWHIFKFEKKFYNFIKIKSWKDKIPDLGKYLEGVSKSKIEDISNAEGLMLFIKKTCSAELCHFYSVIFGFLILVMCTKNLVLTVCLPIAIVNVILNLLPIFVQRYNRPKLIKAYERSLKYKGWHLKTCIKWQNLPK